MQVCDGVHLVAGVGNGVVISDDYDCNVFLVDCGDGFVLIDAGGGRAPDRIIRNITEAGYRPGQCRRILLTHAHADHAAGAAWLASHTGAEVVALPETAWCLRNGDQRGASLDVAIECGVYPEGFRFPPCEVGELADGETFRIGRVEWSVLDTPGHASGHAAYYADLSGRRVLFAGDLVFPGGRIAVQPIRDSSPYLYAKSIAILTELPVDDLIPAHHGWSLGNGHEDILAAHQIFSRLGMPANA